ncbi:hypothetical protein PanWU01x14_220170 [Parasponia andersonii]|uniref:Uncharacterized protein n=1 Tax=Parasponia andersonii TaxID=3476 RepID=A0A2P5BQ34_PARAD|nr:hypothetical protein PanWU01x14_220170 [Parasponia andersonii]
MNRQVVQRSPPTNRRTLLLSEKSPIFKEKRRIGELAGGTAAECAAVCCCFPCALMNFVVLAVYKVPTGLCRQVWEKRKKRQRSAKMKKGLLLQKRPNGPRDGPVREEREAEWKRVKEAALVQEKKINGGGGGGGGGGSSYGAAGTVDYLDEEMWDRFYGAGFWRSPSQREEL